MKKRILTAVVCVMIAFCFGGSASANNEDNKISSKYNFEEACNTLGEKYNICPELLQAMGLDDSYFRSSYDITEHEVKKLYNLYVIYEDNYEVLSRYYKWSKWNNESTINNILKYARKLEEEHGKA